MRREPRIVTVTLNPAIDETVILDELRPGAVNRAKSLHRQAGGKGVNVSAMLGGHGISSVATGFLGQDNPDLFEQLFAALGIRDEFVRLAGETRVGIKLVATAARETTDINFPGLRPTAADLARLEDKLASLATPGTWLVFGGRLPDGIPLARFERLVTMARRAGAHIAADTSGDALRSAIDLGVDLIKPNHHELAEVLGHGLPDCQSRIQAAREIQARGVPHVILSLGAEGALFAAPDGFVIAAPPPVEVISTVGAGDSLLAGYLAGLVTGRSAVDRAKLASAFAWSALEDIARIAPEPSLAAARMASIEASLVERA